MQVLRLASVVIIIGCALALPSPAQTPQDVAEGSLETIVLSKEQTRNFLLIARCTMLGNVRLRLSHGGPDGIPPPTQELEDLTMVLASFIRGVRFNYENIAIVWFDGKWRYKTEVPPKAWEYFMGKGDFIFDPKYFAIAYESICAAGYDPDADTYDVNILTESLAIARAALTKPGKND